MESRDEPLQRELICSLSDDEVRIRGQELARLMQRITVEEGAEALRKKQAKKEIEELHAQAEEKARAVREKQEYRMVEVVEDPEVSSRKVRVIRVDTGEVVEVRPMNVEELAALQGNLFALDEHRAEE